MPTVVSVLPTDLARSRGGGERCALEIHKNIRELLPSWDHIGLGATTDLRNAPMPSGWQNLARDGPGSAHPQDALSLKRLVKLVPKHADLLIVHQWHTRAMAALRIRPRSGFLIAIDHGGGSKAGLQLARLPLPEADLAAIQSKFEARATPLRGRRTCNMRGGIVEGLFMPPAEERRTIDFLLVGRFVPHKGQREFIQALPDGATAQLLGPSGTYDTGYRDMVLGMANERGVGVDLDASDDELVLAYQRARFVVQVPIAPPGAAPELLGLSLLEGMACGSVPVCPDNGASVEFARHGDTGLNYRAGSIEDLHHVLEAALQDEAGRMRLAAAAREESRRWTWPAAARALLREAGVAEDLCTSG